MTTRELLLAAVLIIGTAALVLGGHVAHGGFSYDDWALAADVKYQGFWSTVHFYLSVDHRPLVALYLPLVQGVFGDSAHLQLAWIALAHAFMCWCLYVVLRTLTLERLHAAAIAILVMVFPFADAAWLYVIGSAGTIGVSLYLLGTVAALRGLQAPGRRARTLHALALLLYVASVLTYELALFAILLSVLLYFGRAPLKRVAILWATDLIAMAVTLLLFTSDAVPILPGADVHAVLPLSQWFPHAKLIFHQGRAVLAASLVPFGAPQYTLVGAALLTVISLVVLARLPTGDPARGQLQRWLGVLLTALCGVIAAWLVLVPAVAYYSPQASGVGNRINVFAGVCISVFVYALAMLAGTLLIRAFRRPGSWALGVGVLLAAVLGVGYLRLIDTDKASWRLAATLQQRELSVLRRALPDPRPESVVLLFGAAGYTAPGVPIFAAPWDLNGAVKLVWHDGSVSGYPVIAGTGVNCDAGAVVPTGAGYAASERAPYGTAYFIDALDGAVVRIRTQDQCRRELARLPTGALYL